MKNNDLTLNIKCNDGYCNQLRILLAGVFLLQNQYIKECNINWTITNHNNINFLDYYEQPAYLKFKQLSKHQINLHEATFIDTISKYTNDTTNWSLKLIKAFKTLKLKPNVKRQINKYLKSINIDRVVGIHARRTCKISANEMFNRSRYLLSNQEFINLLQNYRHRYYNVYIATDNSETQFFFKNALKERYISYKDIEKSIESHCTPYDREKVVRFTDPLHTIIDFYTLLNCKHFIGTESSSFSSLIYYLRNNPNDFKIVGGV